MAFSIRNSLWVTGFLLLSGCSLFQQTTVEEPAPVFEYPAPDRETEQLLDAYRGRYLQYTNRVIATAHDTLRFGKPDGGLNNLVADAIRDRAAEESRRFVHIGVIAESLFHLYFEPGQITVGDIIEFAPHDDHLVILKLSGSQVMDLVQQVAGQGGAPISGARFMLDENQQARGILVNAEIVNPGEEYLVATSSQAANGGGLFPVLWNPIERYDYNLSLKELMLDHFRRESDLYNRTDDRIRS